MHWKSILYWPGKLRNYILEYRCIDKATIYKKMILVFGSVIMLKALFYLNALNVNKKQMMSKLNLPFSLWYPCSVSIPLAFSVRKPFMDHRNWPYSGMTRRGQKCKRIKTNTQKKPVTWSLLSPLFSFILKLYQSLLLYIHRRYH